MKKISTFREKNEFLSNFYSSPFVYKGNTYNSIEAAFQSFKTLDEAEQKRIAALSPSEAKRAGRRVSLRQDWEQVKDLIMFELVWAKFSQNSALRDALIATSDFYLEEGNTWHDTYWGVCNGIGQNKLGKILMEVRDALIKQQSVKKEKLFLRVDQLVELSLSGIISIVYNGLQFAQVSFDFRGDGTPKITLSNSVWTSSGASMSSLTVDYDENFRLVATIRLQNGIEFVMNDVVTLTDAQLPDKGEYYSDRKKTLQVLGLIRYYDKKSTVVLLQDEDNEKWVVLLDAFMEFVWEKGKFERRFNKVK